MTYKLASVPKALKGKAKVAAKTGKLTIAKRAKKGTYKLKVRVISKKTANYVAVSKTITVKVKVK